MSGAESTSEQGIVLVPHTHWDREWYEPFQVFRFKLVEMFDEVIERAEQDSEFRFTLDGQTAAIEDYLDVRPENRERVIALVRSGQLAIGPWQILLDEFLCSGETIVRNLEMGWKGAEALGGAMRVGYLPDMFGHIAQMPQILAKAGIGHACLWRGVPAAVDSHSFRWESPDGSDVRVEYLFDSYGNGLDLLSIPSKIPEALRQYRDDTKGRYGSEAILGMVGTDHMAPHPDMMDWVRTHSDDEFPIRVGTLEQYVSRFNGSERLMTVHGEMRSHARGNILPGVISIRRPLKELMAEAERTVIEAEKLSALWSTEDHSPYFDMAWRRIIESSAHDSVVGSGTDETVSQVGARLEEAAHIARAVRDGVITRLGHDVPSDSYLVFNTLPKDRSMLVELEVAAPDPDLAMTATLADGTLLTVQETGFAPTLLGDETIPSAEFGRIMNRIHGRELFGQLIDTYSFSPFELVINVAEVPSTPVFDIARFKEELDQAAADYPGPWRVRTVAQPRRRILVEVPVPALGHTAVRIGQGGSTHETGSSGITVSPQSMDNGLVEVAFAADGTFSVTGPDGTTVQGAGRIVDGGDRGDSYNYGPPANDVLVEEPLEVAVDVVEQGPLRAVFSVTRIYDWPVSLAADVDSRFERTVRTPVRMLVELRRHEPMVRLNVQYVNQAKNHRVRLHVPLPAPVNGSASEGQFAVTERGLSGEGGWGEFPLPTYPAYGFASAGPATVLVEHATEYEAVDGKELAVTLSRSVGSISVNLHPLRDEPAASEIPIPGAQELGSLFEAKLALLVDGDGWQGADAVGAAEVFRSRPLVVRGRAVAEAPLPAAQERLRLTGEGVVLSSLRSVDGELEARLVCMSSSHTTATLLGGFSEASFTDLLGRRRGEQAADGSLTLELGPWEILTVRLK
ncbi:MAG TPA: hypothetical protein VFS79_09250 [Arthrobacter sp.]|nr:hypothetical protein [Arthrobacter sp.]